MDESEKIPVAGRVVWIAKKGVKSPHTPGVGIQFSDPDNIAKDKIETYLAGSLGSARIEANSSEMFFLSATVTMAVSR